MKTIYNSILPVKGFSAINLFGVVLIRKKYKQYEKTASMVRLLNHEAIHTAQMRELGYILFYILYFLEWLFRLATPPMKTAYKDISFEREAKRNECNLNYLNVRKHYSALKYLRDEKR